jgi:hypothetical protein
VSARIDDLLAQERGARNELARSIDARFREMAIGSIRLEWEGVWWVLAGIILATWPVEIAGWF